MQTYIRSVFAHTLETEGFVNLNGDNLHWYRVVSSSIIQAIYFVADSNSLALTMCVGYGSHPLFTEPLFPSGIRIPNRGEICPEIYLEYPNIKSPNTIFSEDCPVLCPKDSHKGLDMLEDIVISKFNRIHSIQDCYLFHREFWFGKELENLWGNQMLMPAFFDEAIYVNDNQVYDRCIHQIELWEREWAQFSKLPAMYAKYIQQMEQQKKIMQGVGRAQYIDVLINRANMNLKKIERKVGLGVHLTHR